MKRIFAVFAVLSVLSFNFVPLADCTKKDVITSVDQFVKTHPDLHAVYEFKKGNKIIAKGASGEFSITSHVKLTPDQVMPVASGTKNIIAAAILKLEEKKLLSTSDTVEKFFPQKEQIWRVAKQNGNQFPEWARKVTIHNLLTHSSGLNEYIFNIQIDPNKSHDEINKQILHFAASKELHFEPGTKFKYCNTGYVILGMIIEKITGENLSYYLKKTFFDPLNMKNTHMASLQEVVDYRHCKLSKYPELYFAFYKNDTFTLSRAETKFVFVPYADGGIMSTADDLVNWHYKLHHGKILSKASYKKMIHPYFFDPVITDQNRYAGYGIFISKLNNKDTLYYHSGRSAGIRSESGYVPSKQLGFAIISNIMPFLDEKQMAKVDFTKISNQLDIYFLMNYVLKNSVKSDEKKLNPSINQNPLI